MKILKKILRIITILLPCLCCSFISCDSFATTYSIDSFNAHGLYYVDQFIGNNPSIDLISGAASRSNFQPRYFANIQGVYNILSDRCELGSSGYNRGASVSNDSITFGGAFYLSPGSGNPSCRRLSGIFGESMPTFVNPTTDNPNYVPIMNILPHNSLFTTTCFSCSSCYSLCC